MRQHLTAIIRCGLLVALVTACVAAGPATSKASAAFGDNHGVAEAQGAAFPDDHAFWAGACDLYARSTSNGGVGDQPPIAAHCIDTGVVAAPPLPWDQVWDTGNEPNWRLDPLSQAGARADATTTFWVRRSEDPHPFWMSPQPDGDTKTVMVKLPPGVVADPGALPKCKSADLNTQPVTCPPATQVGVSELVLGQGDTGTPTLTQLVPVYNAEPRDGKTAELSLSPNPKEGAFGGGANIPIIANVRSESDYGINAVAVNIPGGVPLLGQTITLWGVPWAASHDKFRPPAGYLYGIPFGGLEGGLPPNEEPQPYDPSWGPIRPFFTNPTRCTPEPPVTSIELDSWQNPGEFVRTEAVADSPVTGCELLDFEPTISVTPTSTEADSPTGLEVELEIPQNNEPPAEVAHDPDDLTGAPAYWRSQEGLATSMLEDAVVTLPEGMSVNPASANGQAACSPEEIGLTSSNPVRFDNSDPDDGKGADCPDASKIGVVTIETPLLEQEDWPKGTVYLAEQGDRGPAHGKNPFDSMLAIYIVAKSPKRGLIIKLAGEVDPSLESGQLETTFLNNPQLPFDRFHLRFKGGPRAPLANPTSCGVHTSTAALAPSADPTNPVVVQDSFEITSGPNGSACVADPAQRPFSPKMRAGLTKAVAGAHAPFVFQLTRDDGEQEILSATVSTPPGFTAKLAGIPYCPEPRIAAGTCPEASRIGTEIAGAGAGPSPFYTSAPNQGEVFLAGPYKGAPISIVIHEPVVAGPFDLDDITVRAAVHVNPRTAQLTVVSDPIPQVNSGIPLRVRDLRIRMDRPEFTIAPTNCEPMQIGATVAGSHGASAQLTNRFQMGSCGELGFSPKLDLSFGDDRKAIRPNAHPELQADLDFSAGDANISSVEVALPQGVFLDQARLGRICSRANYAAETCPEESRVGYAKATTPLLDAPVEGPVYLKASDNPLPDLAADLNGQIDVDLFGRIDQKENKKGLAQIRNTFDVVPDVPVSDFQLTLEGGSEGLLVNSRNICRSKRSQRLSIEISAHNGARLSERPLIGSACKRINAKHKKKAKKLKKKAKKLAKKAKRTKKKARRANGKRATKKLLRKSKKLQKKSKKLRKQARKLGR